MVVDSKLKNEKIPQLYSSDNLLSTIALYLLVEISGFDSQQFQGIKTRYLINIDARLSFRLSRQ